MSVAVELCGPDGGPENMAADVRLWKAAEAGQGGARVYTWDGPWVTLGRFQRAERALVPGAPVRWIQRPTGGRCVLHGHDVTVGLAFPLVWLGLSPGAEREVRSVYRAATRPLLQALRACGLDVVLAETLDRGQRGGPSSDCFSGALGLDIVEARTGRKVCGCALRIGQGACLLQASVPAGPPLVDPNTVFFAPAAPVWSEILPADLAASLERAVGPISTPPPRGQSISTL